MPNTLHFAVRKTASKKAILFVHGFSGEAHKTFGMLPAFVAGQPSLTDWDIHCFGYPTSLAPDISGVWSADPDLTTLGSLLNTACDTHFKDYEHLAVIAHSMGGLVVQEALVAHPLANRVTHVALFGTPSNGLRKALLARLFKRQARDMAFGSDFINRVRAAWNQQFALKTPFRFVTVAGVKDEFVPEESSLGPFPQDVRMNVNGNHLEIVKPETTDSDTTVLLFDFLLGSTGVKALRTQPSMYQQTVATFLPRKAMLGEADRVKLALALEMVGRQQETINILEEAHAGNTELTGVLAGRYKRRWLADPDGLDAEGKRALDLYNQAYRMAAQKGDHQQAFYNGINVAFLDLALLDHLEDARTMAREVLTHCTQAPQEKWRFATEGEAHLYLDNLEASLSGYAKALESNPDAREIDSMRKQALWASRLLGSQLAEAQLAALFQTLPGDDPNAKWSG